ncbi:MAG: sugar phosphate isomerase/epimerase [Planctomyces sp.]|nr:sugar phosphate isomerase/epimerase [Planctomyces sp.]
MPHEILLSAFADEAANSKTAIEQFSVLAALGLSHYSPRFVDVTGSGTVKHVTALDDLELQRLAALQTEYGLSVTSIGSRIGKVKLRDVADASHNKYVAPDEYLRTEVAATLRAARGLGAKMIRGFSFYHPQGDDPWKYVDEAVERLGPIVDLCAREGLVYGLEVEANLIGQNGRLLAALTERTGRPNMVCIFDGGNLSSQNMSWMQVYDEYRAMRDHIGWIHIKDYKVDPGLAWTGVVDEERLKNFVPADMGDSAHEAILRDFRTVLPTLTGRMRSLGAPGVFLELEPHLKGGGQFGGFSGPDGLGVAVRALCRLLDYTGIGYRLRTMDDIRAARGF